MSTDAAPAPVYTRSCEGYVYYADQGIEVCETCGGCTCCDHVDVDHRKARYRCLLDREGKTCLIDANSKSKLMAEHPVTVYPTQLGEDSRPMKSGLTKIAELVEDAKKP